MVKRARRTPSYLQCVKDKSRVGLWQSENGWVTNDAKRAALDIIYADDNVLGVEPTVFNMDMALAILGRPKLQTSYYWE